MTATNNVTATGKTTTSLRVEDLESRLLMTAYSFDPGQSFTNQRDVPWSRDRGGDILQVEWEAALFQSIKHELRLEITLNAAEAQSIMAASTDDGNTPASFNASVVQPEASTTAGVSVAFVNPELHRPTPDGDSGGSQDLRPNRRTVKDVLTTRGDVVVAVSLAAHMKAS